MAEFTDVLNEYAHTLYTGLKDATQTDVTLLEELKFDKQNEQGGDYTQHVIVSEEAGFVHGDPTEVMTAPTSVAMETVKATVNGYQVGIVSALDYAKAQRASSGKKAYAEIAGKKQASGLQAMRRRVEDELWTGQLGLGKIASFADDGTTSTILTLTLGEFAPWLWAGKKNHRLVAYDGTTVIASGAAFTITATNVSRAVRSVTVSGIAADITALEAAITGNPNGVSLFSYGTITGSAGTYTAKTMVGAMKAAATTSGTLFGVNLDANSDARPNAYAAGGAMSFAKSLEIAEVLIGRGVVEPLRLDVNPRTWNNLMADQAALVRYNGQQKKIENGADAIVFNVQRVPLEIVGEGRMKEGYALCRPKSGLKRIGAREISMVTPGADGKTKGDIWFHDPTRFAYLWRIWTHQAFFVEEPWKLVGVSGIVNT
jgi:hypothetical protein